MGDESRELSPILGRLAKEFIREKIREKEEGKISPEEYKKELHQGSLEIIRLMKPEVKTKQELEALEGVPLPTHLIVEEEDKSPQHIEVQYNMRTGLWTRMFINKDNNDTSTKEINRIFSSEGEGNISRIQWLVGKHVEEKEGKKVIRWDREEIWELDPSRSYPVEDKLTKRVSKTYVFKVIEDSKLKYYRHDVNKRVGPTPQTEIDTASLLGIPLRSSRYLEGGKLLTNDPVIENTIHIHSQGGKGRLQDILTIQQLSFKGKDKPQVRRIEIKTGEGVVQLGRRTALRVVDWKMREKDMWVNKSREKGQGEELGFYSDINNSLSPRQVFYLKTLFKIADAYSYVISFNQKEEVIGK